MGHIYHKLPYSVKIGPIKKKLKKTPARIKSIHTSRHAGVKNLKNWDRAAEHLTVLTHQLYCSAPCCVSFFFFCAICAGRPYVLLLEVSRGLQHLLLFCFVFSPLVGESCPFAVTAPIQSTSLVPGLCFHSACSVPIYAYNCNSVRRESAEAVTLKRFFVF